MRKYGQVLIEEQRKKIEEDRKKSVFGIFKKTENS
jgi:hypothetical protein